MNRVFSQICILVFAVTLSMPVLADSPLPKDPKAKKYLDMDGYGNVGGLKKGPMYTLCECGMEIFSCPISQAALSGNPDPSYIEIIKDAMYWVKWEKYTFPLNKGCPGLSVAGILASAIWNISDAGQILASMIDSKEKLDELVRNAKPAIYKAFWFLGDKSKVDLMINGFHHDDYSYDHILDTLAVLHTWHLTQEQISKIEEFCVNKVFQNQGVSYANEEKKACIRYLGRIQTKNKDAIEFIINFLGDTQNKVHAIRALGEIGVKEAKDKLKEILVDAKNEETVGKQKKIIYYARDATVPAAIALVGMGDKDAISAINYWLSVNKKDNRLMDITGFEMTFLEAPFANSEATKVLKPLLEKAFRETQTIVKSNKELELYLLRAAIGLAHMGNPLGLEVIHDALKGTNSELRNEALRGLGGRPNYYYSFRAGAGGIKVGDGGLSKSDAENLINTIIGRLKFWTDNDIKTMAAQAILDIRARIRASE